MFTKTEIELKFMRLSRELAKSKARILIFGIIF